MHDQLANSGPIKKLCVLDENTRECLAIEVSKSLRGQDVILTLPRLMRIYGKPAFIGSDNGAEFTAKAVMKWLRDQNIEPAYVKVGDPWQKDFAMARDGLMPSRLAWMNPATGAPWVSVLVSGAMLALVALLGSLHTATAIGGFLYVVHFIPPLLVLLKLRQGSGPEPAFRTPLPRLLLPLAFIMAVVLLVASGIAGLAGGAAWLTFGLALTWARAHWMNYRRKV